MTQEQFEQNIHLSPTFDYDEVEEVKVSFVVWDNTSGTKMFSLELPNPPDRFKDDKFYKTEEWKKIEPEVIKGFYLFYSLFKLK
jgi:hypothetical protein